jgi:hypothetical protein
VDQSKGFIHKGAENGHYRKSSTDFADYTDWKNLKRKSVQSMDETIAALITNKKTCGFESLLQDRRGTNFAFNGISCRLGKKRGISSKTHYKTLIQKD